MCAAIASVIGLNRPGALWSTTAGTGLGALVERREQGLDTARRDLAAKPAQTGDEHQLQLRDDWAFDPHEQIVKLAVLEVVLDAGTTDPTDPTIDDDHLPVVDVPQSAQVPDDVTAGAQWPAWRPQLCPARDAHLNPRFGQPLVELPRAALRIGALTIHDHTDRNAVLRLRDQRSREAIAHQTGPEPELVDVDG